MHVQQAYVPHAFEVQQVRALPADLNAEFVPLADVHLALGQPVVAQTYFRGSDRPAQGGASIYEPTVLDGRRQTNRPSEDDVGLRPRQRAAADSVEESDEEYFSTGEDDSS